MIIYNLKMTNSHKINNKLKIPKERGRYMEEKEKKGFWLTVASFIVNKRKAIYIIF